MIAVAEDGSHRDLVVDESVEAAGWYDAAWTPMDEITGKDFARFGMRAVIEKKGVEPAWSRDRARKIYVARRRDVAAPAATKKTGKK